jgi:hypothetical protein
MADLPGPGGDRFGHKPGAWFPRRWATHVGNVVVNRWRTFGKNRSNPEHNHEPEDNRLTKLRKDLGAMGSSLLGTRGTPVGDGLAGLRRLIAEDSRAAGQA